MKRTSFLATAALAFGWPAVLLTQPLAASAKAPPPPSGDITLRVAPDRDSILRNGPREITLEVEITAPQGDEKTRTPMNLAVVLDRSGSMEGAKIEKARQAACVALDRLAATDIFSLVMYDNDAEVVLPPEPAGSQEHRDQMKARINRIKPGGSTALYAGVQLGSQQVKKFLEKERVNRVILLSDGLANVGPQRTSDLADLGRTLSQSSIGVSTVGVGDDFNEDLMTALAEASHANYYYVKDAEKLPGIFTQELGASRSRVAGNVRIRVEVPAGVRLKGVLGHPEIRTEDRVAEIAMPELFGAERRLYHLQCAVDATGEPAVEFAKVAMAYEDATANKREAAAQIARVTLTDDKTTADHAVRDEVVRNWSEVQNRIDKEAAIKLADEGKAKEASALLLQRAASNSGAPAQQQIADWQGENRKLESLANELSTRGALSKTSRKDAQYDNYQSKNAKK